MGMYTEIYVNVDLKEDTPKAVIDTLRRTGSLFQDRSYYTPRTCVSHLTYGEISKQWSLLGKGDLKNYENEIEHFFNWIMPWVEGLPGDFIGYHRYEEAQEPTLVFLSALPTPEAS